MHVHSCTSTPDPLPKNIRFKNPKIVPQTSQDGVVRLHLWACTAARVHRNQLAYLVTRCVSLWHVMCTRSMHRMNHVQHVACAPLICHLSRSEVHTHMTRAIWDQNARHMGIQSPRWPEKPALADGHLPSAHYPTLGPLSLCRCRRARAAAAADCGKILALTGTGSAAV